MSGLLTKLTCHAHSGVGASEKETDRGACAAARAPIPSLRKAPPDMPVKVDMELSTQPPQVAPEPPTVPLQGRLPRGPIQPMAGRLPWRPLARVEPGPPIPFEGRLPRRSTAWMEPVGVACALPNQCPE